VTSQTAKDKDKTAKVICSNCKKPYHSADFCVALGGKMFGKSFEDAKTAQCMAVGKPPRTRVCGTLQDSSTNITTPAPSAPATTTAPTNSSAPFMINGVPYMLSPVPSSNTGSQANICVHASSVNDLLNFSAFVAIDNPDISVMAPAITKVYDFSHDLDLTTLMNINWDDFNFSVPDLPGNNEALTAIKPQANAIKDSPFVLDTGATCHILPKCSDFHTLSVIPPHPVRGLGRTCVYATGLRTIKLLLSNEHKLVLHNVLYIPVSRVRLVSVLALNSDSDYTSHFGATTCWITTGQGTQIAEGQVSSTRGLYILSITTCNALVTTPFPDSDDDNDLPTTDTTLYTTPVPDVETWHCRLGHCSSHTVINMA